MHFVIAYDIEQNRRRNKVMSTLKNYGLRVQYSVFECDFDFPRLVELKIKLSKLVDTRVDKVHFYPMCDACYFRSESIGRVSDEAVDV